MAAGARQQGAGLVEVAVGVGGVTHTLDRDNTTAPGSHNLAISTRLCSRAPATSENRATLDPAGSGPAHDSLVAEALAQISAPRGSKRSSG